MELIKIEYPIEDNNDYVEMPAPPRPVPRTEQADHRPPRQEYQQPEYRHKPKYQEEYIYQESKIPKPKAPITVEKLYYHTSVFIWVSIIIQLTFILAFCILLLYKLYGVD